LCNTTLFWQNFWRKCSGNTKQSAAKISDFGSEIQIRVWNLVFDIKILESTPKIQNRTSRFLSLIPLESRFET
jgi:hypothetical protein